MQHDVHRTSSFFRLSQPIDPDLPLRVRSTGRYDVVANWSEPPVKKWFVELTWTVSGEGEALMGDRYVRLRPEMSRSTNPARSITSAR